jgi:endonuclease/exonuclease/phosphatase (EEP) superfamily protein YafD
MVHLLASLNLVVYLGLMRLNRDLSRFLIVGIVGLTVASVAPLFGHLALWLELFVHFKVHYVLVSIILLLAAIKIRRHGIAIAALVLAIFNFSAVVPSLKAPSVAASAPHLKVITLNVLDINPSPGDVIDFLRRERADIVVLEEAEPPWMEKLKTLADVYPHMLLCEDGPDCGLALLSKKPWRLATIRKIAKTGPRVVVAKYDLGGARFTLVGTHLEPPTPSFFHDHEHYHHEHVEKFSTMLGSISGPLVVVGDFNATQWSPSFNRIIGETGLSRVEGGILPTWPSQLSFIGIPIDQILITAEFKGSSMMRGPRVNSDHFPLIANLSIGDKGQGIK